LGFGICFICIFADQKFNMKTLSYTIGLLIMIAFAIAGCSSSSTQGSDNTVTSDDLKNPNTADGVTDTSNLPRFEFDEEIHDFGRVIQGEKVSYSFRFKNSGKTDLVIASANGSCGCTIADYPKKPVPPNGEGTIDVTFNTETKKGYQNKTVTVIANTQPNTKILTIKAQIQVPEGE
jgi:hypothetical protein